MLFLDSYNKILVFYKKKFLFYCLNKYYRFKLNIKINYIYK